MTAILELPDDVMLTLNARAAREHKQPNDILMDWIKIGFGKKGSDNSDLPPLLKTRGGYVPTFEEMREMIEEGRETFATIDFAHLPEPLQLRGGYMPTVEQIIEWKNEGRE